MSTPRKPASTSATTPRKRVSKDAAKRTKRKSGAAESPASVTPVATKSMAVAAAVANQLRHEHRWPPNDLNKVMGDGYHYDKNSMTNFLVAVRWHLAYGGPKLYFQFNAPFVAGALGLNAAQLSARVDANTSTAPPPNWIAP